MGRYDGKVAWITGGGTGIGRSLALEFVRHGGSVVVSGRRRERLDEVVAAAHALGGRVVALPLDVTDEAACQAAVGQVVAEFKRLDCVVANAGYGSSGPILRLTAEDWRRQFDVNVIGVVNTAKAAIPELTKTGGRLALVASVMGMVALAGQGPYAASKFAVRAIGLTLAQELHGSGVSCTTIAPGFVESEIGQVGLDGHFDASRRDKRPQKLMWTADHAARVMWPAIDKRKREFVFTMHGKVAGFLGRHLPGLVHFVGTRERAKRKALSSAKVGP